MHILDDLNAELPLQIWAEGASSAFKKLSYCAGQSAKIFSLREQGALLRVAAAQG
jgi:hypothetical protein